MEAQEINWTRFLIVYIVSYLAGWVLGWGIVILVGKAYMAITERQERKALQ